MNMEDIMSDQAQQQEPIPVTIVKSRSRLRNIFTGVALMAAGAIGHMVFTGNDDKAPVSGKIVSVIDMKGVIASGGGGSLFSGGGNTLSIDSLSRKIDAAFNRAGTVAVALDVNSPGGSPTQSELIANLIQRRSKEKNIPVYAFVQDIAASGGYWIACSADEIYTAKTSTVGSIGVVAESMGYAGLAKTLGVESRTYTAGNHKRRLDPLKPENPADVEWMKGRLGQMHTLFKDWIKECRNGKLPTDPDAQANIFSGDAWLGEEAKALGLTDGIGEMLPVLHAKFGDDIVLVNDRQDVPWWLSSAMGAFGGHLNQTVTQAIVEGVVEEIRQETVWGPYQFR